MKYLIFTILLAFTSQSFAIDFKDRGSKSDIIGNFGSISFCVYNDYTWSLHIIKDTPAYAKFSDSIETEISKYFKSDDGEWTDFYDNMNYFSFSGAKGFSDKFISYLYSGSYYKGFSFSCSAPE